MQREKSLACRMSKEGGYIEKERNDEDKDSQDLGLCTYV